MIARLTEADFEAYADGKLARPAAEAVENAMADNPAVARRIAALVTERRVEGSDFVSARAVVPSIGPSHIPEARPARLSAGAWGLAAGVAAVAIGLTWYFAQGFGPSAAGATLIGRLDRPGIEDALDHLATGEVKELGESRLRAVATFRLGNGQLCREFALADGSGSTDAVACRATNGWIITFAMFEPAGGAGDYVPAGASDLIVDYLDQLGVGEALTGSAEADALARVAL